ncbi:interleukin-12 receptor subunit beta-2 isoform 1-T1 [Odontesthes bonariensis]|uniref:interleukin-12 receptor subunit beta-2 n=1 Tax=Odontesthes bonariensis TaxID=219752 RepID=UPI003F584640
MATMFLTWSIVIAVTVLAVQLCVGETSCFFWSTAGYEVHIGSSFEVYCTFNCKCKGSMYRDNNITPERHKEWNTTTIYLSVTNITEKRTYSCRCPPGDPCGKDISAGYPLDPPKNVSCIYKILKNESGVVVCTWNRGRDTYLLNNSALWVRTVSGNHTEGPVLFNVIGKGTKSLSASFSVTRSVQLISVWVQAQNSLGSVESPIINYTLSDIVMPSTPVLGQPECSSRKCIIKVEQSVRIQHLQIQYRDERQQQWATYADSVLQRNSSQAWSISSLEPYRLYQFRARSKFSTGLWSQWSSNISSWTQEEAPTLALDVWFAPASDSKSMRIYWKEANMTVSSGRISEYTVRVFGTNLSVIANVSADVRNYSVPLCADCEVTVWARNSKGLSPPNTMTTLRTKAKHLRDVQATSGHNNITISWRKPETAPAMYLLEWYPVGHMLEELRWVRLDKNVNGAVLTDIKPFECYEGAVYVFYNESSVSRTGFKRVAALESVPKIGPSVQEKVEAKKVTITWTKLPRGQRGGCITNYTIYLENNSGQSKEYSVQASESTYVIQDLPPAVYNLRMSASTAKGKGPRGQQIKFFIEEDTQLPFALVCVVAALMVLFLMCLCQSSVIKQRFWEFFQCLMLDVVPDPANSKWAKECTKDKGKMNLQLPSGNSTLTEKEEETILVDVEELFKKSSDTPTVSSQLLPLPSLSPETELYPTLTTYIKSFSHDSDSSDHTQTSLDTTVDYISSNGPGIMDDEDQEEEEEFADLHFFPSHNIFMETLEFGGKLTLDAVKIDCSGFFESA